MTAKRMELDIGVSNLANTVGFGQVKNFEGAAMLIDPKYMKEALFALVAFDKKRDQIEIGITDKIEGGAFFIFLDKKREMAIIARGRAKE